MGRLLYLSSHAEHTTPHSGICRGAPQWYSTRLYALPTVEYAGLPHSGTRLYALPTVEYAEVPHSGTRLHALPTVEYAGVPHSDTRLYALPTKEGEDRP